MSLSQGLSMPSHSSSRRQPPSPLSASPPVPELPSPASLPPVLVPPVPPEAALPSIPPVEVSAPESFPALPPLPGGLSLSPPPAQLARTPQAANRTQPQRTSFI